MPFTVQVTAVFEFPVTTAERFSELPVCTVAVEGLTLTLTGAGFAVMTTSAIADFVGSWLLTAVIVTVLGLGTVAGAV
jgi:hypothetical protein